MPGKIRAGIFDAMPGQSGKPDSRRAGRTYDPAQTHSELVAAGIDLFGRQGFHATSVREIVDAAGLTKGAFYHHFDSKEDLLHMIHDEFIEFHLEGQRLILEGTKTPHECLFHLVRLLVYVVAEYTGQVSVYFQEHRALAGKEFADVHLKRTEARKGFEDAIAAGIATGDFRQDTDPKLASLGILGMGNWTYQWYPPSKADGWSAEEIACTYGLMALRSLSAKPRKVTRIAARGEIDDDPVLELLARRQASPGEGTVSDPSGAKPAGEQRPRRGRKSSP